MNRAFVWEILVYYDNNKSSLFASQCVSLKVLCVKSVITVYNLCMFQILRAHFIVIESNAKNPLSVTLTDCQSL